MSDEASSKNESPSDDQGGKRRRSMRNGVAFGIGSAAIVAALLYANRNRRTDRGDKD